MKFTENDTVPKMIKKSSETYGDIVAQYKRQKNGEFEPVTYREMYQLGLDFGAALLQLGIQRGDLIGLIGSTGRSVGPHLHWEVIVNSTYVNPVTWLSTQFP